MGSTQKEKNEVWVRSVAHAPALHPTCQKIYLFHTDFDDGDGDIALFGKCPELVAA
jgi:hypothetical protein